MEKMPRFKSINKVLKMDQKRIIEKGIDKLDLISQLAVIGIFAKSIVEKLENLIQSDETLQKFMQSNDFLGRVEV